MITAADLHPIYGGVELALRGDATRPSVQELSRCRLYPDEMPHDPQLPGVRYALLTDVPHQRLASGENFTAELQVDVYCVAGDGRLAWSINAAVRRVLDRANLTVAGCSSVHAMCVSRGRPLIENPYYRVISQYRLFGTAA